jgi:DNA replication protein DnaC
VSLSDFLCNKIATTKPPRCPVCGEEMQFTEVPSPIPGGQPWKRPLSIGHEKCLEQSNLNKKEKERLEYTERQIRMLKIAAFSLTELNPEKRQWFDFKKTTDNQTVYEKCLNWTSGQKGFLLHGQPGSGKTHLVCGLVQRVIERDQTPCLVLQVRPFLDKILLSPFEIAEELILRAMHVEVLILDDFGAGAITEAADERLQRILDARLEYDRSTWATTNLSGAAFKEKLTPRTASRALALMKPMSLSGTDHRMKGVP